MSTEGVTVITGKLQLAQVLRQARLRLSLSQESVARNTGVSQKSISAIESGRMEPSLQTLFKILPVVGLSLSILGSGPKPAPPAPHPQRPGASDLPKEKETWLL